MWILERRPWDTIREAEATPRELYFDRRAFLKRLGLTAAGVSLGAGSTAARAGGARNGTGDVARKPPPAGPLATIPPTPSADLYPAQRNATYTLDRPITDRVVAATHNNFYEFTTTKDEVWRLTSDFEARPWTLEVGGLVDRPGSFDVAELERSIGLEERLYRHRCVEAWSMAVPWTGFPLAALLARVQPLSAARYVRFVSFLRPEQAVGQRTQTWYPWPYYEALRLDEALNPLTLVVTGIYGEPMPKQHGAPVRIVTPWKYGYKSPKSIVKIELTREQPPTLWNDMQPLEYGFYSNVNPAVPHPRWSQATEELIGTGMRLETLPFNGYGDWVAELYTPEIMSRIS